MKNLLKLFAVVLVSAFFMISCGDILKRGGTIAVTNGLSMPTYVIIVEGIDYLEAISELTSGGGTIIPAGGKKSFQFDKDGIYTVVAMPPITPPFTDTITLALGNKEQTTVK